MSSENQNIVLITADSLRADHCGFLNSAMATTPTLDRMAEEGVVFENAVAPGPRTLSSIPEIFTGKHLPKTEADDWSYEVRMSRIGGHMANNTALPERLGDRGYATAAYTANPWTTPGTNFEKGFDHFHEIKNEREMVNRFSGTALEPITWMSNWMFKETWFSQWPTFYEDILQTVEQLESPYFLWVFLLDTHTPFMVPRRDRTESSTLGMYDAVIRGSSIFGEQEGKSYYRKDISPGMESRLRQAYRDSIRSVDRFVNNLWHDMRDDDPTFVFHSDHGEAFGEHGTYGHQQTMYEENLHVPLLVYNCGRRGRVRQPISLRRLSDMLTSYADEGSLEPAEWTSEYTVSRTEDSETMAVRSERWKYISSGGSEELYDLYEDPTERRNLLDRETEVAAQFRSVLESYRREIPDSPSESGHRTSPDQELEDRLSSLGYLG